MERFKHMKDMLINCAQSQMSHLDQVDAKELGEVIDMIKDLEEAIYYCTITKSMNEQAEKSKEYYYPEYERNMDKQYGRMYYPYEEPIMYYTGGYNGNHTTHDSTMSANTTYPSH